MKYILTILLLFTISFSFAQNRGTIKVQSNGSVFDSSQINEKLAGKLNATDTATMLSPYLKIIDTINLLSKSNNYILTNPSLNYIDNPNSDIIFAANTSQPNRITGNNQLREIFGGYDNQIDSNIASSIISSRHSLITGFVDHGTILGGSFDTIDATSGTGSKVGIISSSLSKIKGYNLNYSGILFSQSSTIDSSNNASAISGFTSSVVKSSFGSVVGGYKGSLYNSPNTVISGGMNDTANNSSYSFVGSGLRIKALGGSYIGALGGSDITLRGSYSGSIGGLTNTQSNAFTTEGSIFLGGLNNTMGTARDTRYSWMSGRNGVLSGDYAAIIYGFGNTLQGDYAAALGRNASVTATGSVSWADGSGTGVTNVELYKFNLFFTNGYKLAGGTTTVTGLSTAYVAKSADYTATATDYTIAITATGTTQTLPTAVGIAGREYVYKLTASGSATIATTSSQTIDGSSTYSLSAQYKYVRVQSDGTNWIIVGNN